MQVLGYTYHTSGLTIIATDGQYVIPSSHPNFIEIEGILDERWGVDDDLPIDDLVSIPDTVNRRTGGKVLLNLNLVNNLNKYLNRWELFNLLTMHNKPHKRTLPIFYLLNTKIIVTGKQIGRAHV